MQEGESQGGFDHVWTLTTCSVSTVSKYGREWERALFLIAEQDYQLMSWCLELLSIGQ